LWGAGSKRQKQITQLRVAGVVDEPGRGIAGPRQPLGSRTLWSARRAKRWESVFREKAREREESQSFWRLNGIAESS
jgi:hypothetical protein